MHWGARLVRAPGVVYTEVAGTPVLVRVDDAELQPMSPAWVSCWAGLDGRPVAEALDVDPDTVDPITSRNLIEVLRRLKAKRLIADVDSLSPDDRAAATSAFPDDQPVAGPTDIVLRGHLAESPDGPILTLPAPTASLAGDEVDHGLGDTRPDLLTVHLAEVNGTLTPSIVGAKLTIVTESRPESAPAAPTAMLRGASTCSRTCSRRSTTPRASPLPVSSTSSRPSPKPFTSPLHVPPQPAPGQADDLVVRPRDDVRWRRRTTRFHWRAASEASSFVPKCWPQMCVSCRRRGRRVGLWSHRGHRFGAEPSRAERDE